MTDHFPNLWKRLAAASAVGLLAQVAATPTALAQAAPAFDLAAPNAQAPAKAGAPFTSDAHLSRLLASPMQLQLSGENPHGSFPVFVTGEQSTRPSELTIGYSSAVSVTPESSSLVVLVNDVSVVERPLVVGAPQTVSAPVPPGLLRPGYNAVRVLVRQSHRVDCTIEGTYELWTRIDGVTSGLHFSQAATSISSLSELPALARDEDGRLRIDGKIRAGATPDAMDRTLAAVQAVGLLAGADNADVHLGDEVRAGPGIDVVVGTYEQLGPVARTQGADTAITGVLLVGGKTAQRPTLVVTGATTADVDVALSALRSSAEQRKLDGSPAGLRAFANLRGHALDAGQSVKLSELDSDERPFAGRLFKEDITLALPADFYPADYDSAGIVLEAGYAAQLASNAMLAVRANDRIVATLPLSSPRAGQIRDQRLRLPLESLKPGLNRVSFEAILPREDDAACEVGAGEQTPRFALSSNTRIEMPSLARVGSYPNLSATLSGLRGLSREQDALSIYVPGNDRPALDVAASMVARMAVGSGSVRSTRFVTVMPHSETGDLLAVGTYSMLPAELMAAVRLNGNDPGFNIADPAQGWTSVGKAQASAREPDAADPAELETTNPLLPAASSALSSFAEPIGYRERIEELAQNVLKPVLTGLKPFSIDKADEDGVPPDNALVVAQAAAPSVRGAAWTVLAAPTSDILMEGSRRLGERQAWSSVSGARTEVSVADDQPIVSALAEEEQLFETQPRTIGNMRLVLAGWFSRNSEDYAALVLGSSVLLAFSTLLLLRRVGEKSK